MTDGYRQRIFGLLALLLTAQLLSPTAGMHAQDDGANPNNPLPPQPAVDGGQAVDDNLLVEAQAAIQAAEYAITWQEGLALAGATAAYQAPNRAQGLRSYFTPDGIVLVPRDWTGEQVPAWDLRLALAGAAPAELAPAGNQITFRRPGATAESYRNEPGRLTQQFELAAGEETQSGLTLAVDTSLRPTVATDGQAVDFADASGAAVLRYTVLQATDAAGRSLPINLAIELTGGEQGRGFLLRCAIDTSGGASGAATGVATGSTSSPVPSAARGAIYPVIVTAAVTSLAAPATAGGLHLDWSVTMESDQAEARFGVSVATAGDVNGDGYADVIVGAPKYDNGQENAGKAFVYPGGPRGLRTSPVWTAEGDQERAYFGNAVATAGDVNGDGYSDIVVAAPYLDNGEGDEGRVYVYHGGAGGLSPSPAWTQEGDLVNAHFGAAVAPAGDVNGDGFADVIVGASFYSNDQTFEGRAYVFHGGAGGLGANAAWTAESDQADAFFGASVGTAGDVNGDGFADVIVGAPGYDNGQADEGGAYVFHGGGGGVSASPAWSVEGGQAGANLGMAVGTAGDVGGDGYADVVVGAPNYDNDQTDEGRAYVYFGAAAGLDTFFAWNDEGDQDGANLGAAVATTGDVNGDGYADVVVGAPKLLTPTGTGVAFVYYGAAGFLRGAPGWTGESPQTDASFGAAVAPAGDVNGDGYADVIVGAPDYDNGQTDEGRALVYHGAPGAVSNNPVWTAEGRQAYAKLGSAVATAGDVNGDGYADVIVGASGYDNDQKNEGRAYVYLGGPTGLGNSTAWTAEGNQADAAFGEAVASAGDVNGDGYADVVVGAPYFSNGQTREGRAFVFHGGPAGLDTYPAWTAESNHPEAAFGFDVRTAGDVNGDGYADVIVGAPGYRNGNTIQGHAYVFLGGPGGLDDRPVWTAEGDRVPDRAAPEFGYSVGTAGDVNGDGYADVIVGADGHSNGQPQEGRAYVYHGGAGGVSASPAWRAESDQVHALFGISVDTAGDVNGDGYADVIVGAGALINGDALVGRAYVYYGSANGLGLANWVAGGDQAQDHFGWSVSTAGDANGDGYADVIVGAPFRDIQVDEGQASVFLGGPGGLSARHDWTAIGDGVVALFGYSVASAGDVNGDGYADVIVGVPGYSTGNTSQEGRAVVYYGNDGGMDVHPRQRRWNLTAPVAPGGLTEGINAFRLTMIGRTPFGRGRIKLEWEVKPLGVLLDGQGISARPSWMNPGTGGAAFNQVVEGLVPNTPYHWRMRVRYHPATTPFQQYGRWITVPWHGWNETALRTDSAATNLYLPLVVR